VSCGNDLRNCARELQENSERNEELRNVLFELQSEVDDLKSVCRERGVLPVEYEDDDMGVDSVADKL